MMMPIKMKRTCAINSVWKWLSILLFASITTSSTTTTPITYIHAQSVTTGAGGSPWIIPFGIITEEEEADAVRSWHELPEYFASALVYDSELDRIYVTGVSRTRQQQQGSRSYNPTASPTDDYDGYANDDDDTEQYSNDDAYYYNDRDDDDDANSSSNDTTTLHTKSDCFLGILQVPRRSHINGDPNTDAYSESMMMKMMANSNDWIRQHGHIGTRGSQEACSGIDIVRRGNDRKVYLIGHSTVGPSLLENQLHWYNSTHQIHEHFNDTVDNATGNTTASTNGTNTTNVIANQTATLSTETPVVYGFVMDVTWYNGHVSTGYLMHHVPVEYPIGVTASSVSSSHEDLYVVSIQSLSGMANPAHTLYENLKRQMDGAITNTSSSSNSSSGAYSMLYDTTTSGSYLPPAYGESYSFNLRRIGERSQSLMEIMTLPGAIDDINHTTLYESKVEGSKLLNLLKLSKTIQTAESSTTNTPITAAAKNNSNNKTSATDTNLTATATSPPTDANDNETTPPLSFGEYRFVVEPLVERWGRTFAANIQEETPNTTTTLRPALYSIQVSSILRCTITTLEESTTVVNGEHDDDTNDDDHTDDDAITYVQRRQDMIFVAGSTRGSGLASGGAIPDTSLHGFVSSFDAVSGVLLRRRPIVTSNSGTTTSSSGTVSRNPGYTVRVFGLCQQDPYSQQTDASMYSSAQYIYVVGMTDGILDHQSYATQQHQSATLRVGVYQAFIQKIDAVSLSVQWTKQIGAAKFLNGGNTTQHGSIHGISCAVTPDGFQVYLGGTVIGGASVSLNGGSSASTKSYGRDDIFVAQYMTSDGKLNYVKQIGTPQDDALASGVSMVADKYGNAIVLGNTRGSLFGFDNTTNLANKVILLSIDRGTGNHVDISGNVDSSDNVTDSMTSQQPTPGPTGTPVVSESSLSSWSDLSDVNIVYICVLGAIFATALACMFVSLYTCRQRSRTDKMISRYILSAAAEASINKKDRMHDKDDCNAHRSNDVEHANLFTNDYDREYATESSYDDDYETVSFVPSSSQVTGQTSLHSGPSSGYKDTLLHSGDPNRQDRVNDRARMKRIPLRNVQVDQEIDDNPLRRWLVRDP